MRLIEAWHQGDVVIAQLEGGGAVALAEEPAPRPGLFLPTLGRPSQPAGLTLKQAAGAVLYATGDAEVGIAALAQERRPLHWMLRHEDIGEVQDAQLGIR